MFFKDTVGARAFAALAGLDTLLAAYALHLCLSADGACSSTTDDRGPRFWVVEDIGLGWGREMWRRFREHGGWGKERWERRGQRAGRRGKMNGRRGKGEGEAQAARSIAEASRRAIFSLDTGHRIFLAFLIYEVGLGLRAA